MSWPLSQDYNEAIQSPQTSFSDPELRAGTPIFNALGLPVPCSGNFADVYEFDCPKTTTRWAVKCFTRQVQGLRERYAHISGFLRKTHLPFTVDFHYLDKGIRIRGAWYPVLKMRWVEGLLLNAFVRENIDKPSRLDALSQAWRELARRLREASIAHGDLQHGNVILVPGGKENSLKLKLIDYDGMFIPALAGMPSGEVGHANYQHPLRLNDRIYNAEVDRFPLLVVATALRALIVGGRSLWERHDNGDNLLFREQDLRSPRDSALIWEIARLNDPEVRRLVDCLSRAAYKALEQTPPLEEIRLKNLGLPPLPDEQAKGLPPLPEEHAKVAGRWSPIEAAGVALLEGSVAPALASQIPTVIATPVNFDFGQGNRTVSMCKQPAKPRTRSVLIGMAAAVIAIVGAVFAALSRTWPADPQTNTGSVQEQDSGSGGKKLPGTPAK